MILRAADRFTRSWFGCRSTVELYEHRIIPPIAAHCHKLSDHLKGVELSNKDLFA
jgi:hypothetical protein